MVLSSSFSGKTGPKVGSIGYVSGDPIPNIDGESFFLLPMEIVFTRYGFESKTRRECKRFIAVAPMGPRDINEKDRIKVLKEALRSAYDIRNKKCNTLDFIKSTKTFRSSAVGIVAPAARVNLMAAPQEERLAWLESHVKTERILPIIDNMRAKFGKVNNGFGNDFLTSVFLMNGGLHARLEIMSALEKDNAVSNFIAVFQRFLTVGFHDSRREELESLVEWFEQMVIDSHGKETQLLTTLMGLLFCHEFEALANIVLPRLPQSTSSRVFFMKELKSKLVSLARILEDTKNPKSITVHP